MNNNPIERPALKVLSELQRQMSGESFSDLTQKIIQHMMSIFDIEELGLGEYKRTWKHSDTEKIYKLLEIPEKPEKLSPAYKKNIKHVNKTLYQILKYLRKCSTLKKPDFPHFEVQLRPDLSTQQDNEAYCLLDDYHDVLNYFQQTKPNNRKKKSTVHVDLTLVLIAFDGLIKTGIDYNIARLQRKHVYLGSDARIEIHIGKTSLNSNSSKIKSYPICTLTSSYMKISLPRCNKGYLFPRNWRIKTKRKSKRKEALNQRLREIWNIVHPSKPVPEHWSINLWIRLSRLSMGTLGTPYIVISSLTCKLNAAQLLHHESSPDIQHNQTERCIKSNNSKVAILSEDFDTMHEIVANNIFLRIREIMLSYSPKVKTKPEKRKASNKIELLLEEHQAFLSKSPNTKLLIEWIIWTLRCQKYRKNKFSTFLTYFSILPCRLLPILGEQQISLMSATEWVELASFFASGVDYASSSKRQTIIHLRSLHTFMTEKDSSTPDVNWSTYEFRIQKGIAQAKVVSPAEIEKLLNHLDPNDSNWLVIVLAFYGGLRCEEICGLKHSDFIDGYKFTIAWSKRHTSKRSVPISWLIPNALTHEFHNALTRKTNNDDAFLIVEKGGGQTKPNTLGKRISRLLEVNKVSVKSIHALRHGFASWTLIRYFMLTDPLFCCAVKEGQVISDVREECSIFSNESLQSLARTLGGSVWESSWLSDNICLGIPTDIAKISALLGHTNRYTPIENYFNSMEWIIRYYVYERVQEVHSLYE